VSSMLPPLPVYGLPGRDALLHQLKERLFSGGNLALCAQVGLEAVLTLVHQKLDEPGRHALRALSVFPPKPSTFSPPAALETAAVATTTLNQLAGRGLLECGGSGRYYLHPAVAAYARRQANLETRLVPVA
jgi:hypothetical protein